jgi:hypothetical protein
MHFLDAAAVMSACRLEVKPRGGAEQSLIPVAELIKLAEAKQPAAALAASSK